MTVERPEERSYQVDGKLVPLGYQQITDVSSAVSLDVPKGTRIAIIQAIGVDVRWRDDGTDPTASVGMVIGAGLDIFYVADFAKLRLIETEASAELNISYYF